MQYQDTSGCRGHHDLRPRSSGHIRSQNRLLGLHSRVRQQPLQRCSGIPGVDLDAAQRVQCREVRGDQHEVDHRTVRVGIGLAEQPAFPRQLFQPEQLRGPFPLSAGVHGELV